MVVEGVFLNQLGDKSNFSQILFLEHRKEKLKKISFLHLSRP